MQTNLYNLRENIVELKCLLFKIFPKGKVELSLFAFFFLFYVGYSVVIALASSVIDSVDLPYDIYFGFDNPTYFHKGYSDVFRHPLLKEFLFTFLYIGDLLAHWFVPKAKTLFAILICASCISFSVVYVYRYLRSIVETGFYSSLLFTSFFGFCFINLILSFTVESFTVAAFFLSFTVYYYSDCIRQDKTVRLIPAVVLAVANGGVTITNFAKGVLPILFLKDSMRVKSIKILISSLVFFFIILAHIGFVNFFSEGFAQRSQYAGVLVWSDYFSCLISYLFGSPIFCSSFFVIGHDAILMDVYMYWWQFLFVFILLGLLCLSLFRNRKNRLVLFLFSFVCLDLLIHGILRFGLGEAFMYGAHWIYVLPLFLGWLYKSLNGVSSRLMFGGCALLLVCLMINNFYRLYEFIELAKGLHPAVVSIY